MTITYTSPLPDATAADDCAGVAEVRVDCDGFKLSTQWTPPTISIKQLLLCEMLLVGKLDIDSRQHINQFSVLHGMKHIVGIELVTCQYQ